MNYNMKPRIVTISEKKLAGKSLVMSYADFKPGELWRSFLPRRKEIKNNLTGDLISLAVYKPGHFEDFKLTNEFQKWALVEVSDFNNIPEGFETFILPGGLYAVFDYKGLSTNNSVFQYILGVWLPWSEYLPDNRPHFEVLGEKYRNNDPDSEEEIWIPIRKK